MVAARLGFEPRQTESESVVLPLHNRAICCLLTESTFIIITLFLEMSTPFFKKIKLFSEVILGHSIGKSVPLWYNIKQGEEIISSLFILVEKMV